MARTSKIEDPSAVPVALVDLTPAVARSLAALSVTPSLAGSFGDAPIYGSVVGRGDTLDISIWEAPPAVLFGSVVTQGRAQQDVAQGRATALPEQIVDQSGMISVPFAGAIRAVGRTPEEISQDIQKRLAGKAHDPQVIVRIAKNTASEVTVIGDVATSIRMPLSSKGERLLDALASAGGVRQPINKMTIQVTRGASVASMALAGIISDPRENIRLGENDIVAALFQPYSFTILGAARKNEEIPFEGTGLTLSQALGRMGGLDDQRANPRGVFIFRFEDPKLFTGSGAARPTTKEGKIPVIYRVDMRDPQTLFAAQSFAIKDKDVVFVSNAPLADFQKFLQAVSQIVYPIAVIQTTNIF